MLLAGRYVFIIGCGRILQTPKASGVVQLFELERHALSEKTSLKREVSLLAFFISMFLHSAV